jgi:hypothetical protein
MVGLPRQERRSLQAYDARCRRVRSPPNGFHRIRHYGLFANATRAANIALARRLLGAPDPAPSSSESDNATVLTKTNRETLVLAAAGA